MASLVVIYKTPKNPAAFDDYYFSKHVPLAKHLPKMQRYETSKGAVHAPAGASGVHLVATLTFASLADIQAAFASPEGQAAAADVATFADGGVDMIFFDTQEV